jgi:hypothetical protein
MTLSTHYVNWTIAGTAGQSRKSLWLFIAACGVVIVYLASTMLTPRHPHIIFPFVPTPTAPVQLKSDRIKVNASMTRPWTHAPIYDRTAWAQLNHVIAKRHWRTLRALSIPDMKAYDLGKIRDQIPVSYTCDHAHLRR